MPDGSFSTAIGDMYLGILAIQGSALTEGKVEWICDDLPSEKEAVVGWLS